MKKVFVSVVLCAVFLFALSSGAFAAAGNFVPSVAGKAAPAVTEVVTKDGPAAGVVVDKDGNEQAGVPIQTEPDGDGLAVTAMADADKASDPAVKEELYAAYKELSGLESVDTLNDDVKSEIDARGADASNLAVRDLFYMGLYGKYADALKDGAGLTVTFDADMKKSDFLLIMVKNADGEWVPVSEDDMVINDDGTVTVTFHDLGAVALVTETAAGTVKDVPETNMGDNNALVFLGFALLCASALAGVVVAGKKLFR